MTEVHATIDAVLDLRPGVPQEIRTFVRSIDDPSHLADNTWLLARLHVRRAPGAAIRN